MRKNKYGQLKIQEMSFMLLAVVLFFILVGLFYLAIRIKTLRGSASDLAQEESLSTIINLAKTAEFACVGEESACIDADKLIVMLDRQGYEYLWPVDSLKIIKLGSEEKICNMVNYPDCNVFEVFDEGGEQIYENVFVSLCRKDVKNTYAYDKCEIAKIIGGTKKNEK